MSSSYIDPQSLPGIFPAAAEHPAMPDPVSNNLIEISLRAIKSHCDGGSERDGKGFRPGDSILVGKLLTVPIAEWTPEQEAVAINLLSRYRKQLSTFGINYEALAQSIKASSELADSIDTCELVETRQLTDRVQATIRLSRAAFQNKNEREYIPSDMAAAAADANRRIAAGVTLVGYDDEDNSGNEAGHPEPVFNDLGDVVGFNYYQYEPAFKFLKFNFNTTTNELFSDIEALEGFQSGQRFAKKLINKTPIKFSMRALGGCQVIDGKRQCSTDIIEGGDAVKTPALEDADVLQVRSLADSKPKNKLVLNDCLRIPQGCGCSHCNHDHKPTILTRTEQKPITPISLGDRARARPRVSGPIQSKKTRTKLGDAKMITPELMKMIEGESDAERIKLMLAAAAAAGSNEAPAEAPMVEAKKPEDPNAPPMMDETKLADTINKSLEEKFKTIVAESELNALKEVTAERESRKAKQAVADSIAAIQTTGEIEGRKLTSYSEAELKEAFEIASAKPTAEAAKQSLIDSLTIHDKNKMRGLASGVKTYGSSGATVLNDEGDKNAEGAFAHLEKGIKDRIKTLRGEAAVTEYEQRAKVNKPFVDQLLNETKQKDKRTAKALADWGKRVLNDSANLISESDLRNQEGLLNALFMKQVYQKLVGLQFCKNVTAPGRMVKIPLWSYTPPSAGSTRRFYEVRSGEDIAQAESAIRYYKMFTRLYGLSFSIGEELLAQLQDGPLGINASGMLLNDITDDLSRQIDTRILHEHQHTCDQYLSTSVTSEAVAAAEWTYSGGGSASMDLGGDIGTVTYGTNVCGIAKLLTGYATGYTGHPRPIVEPKTTYTIDDDNLGAFGEDYSVSVATLGGVTQVRGYLDSDGNIQALVPGQTATYAIDNENGTVVFKVTGTSGAAAGVRPTVTYYYATNYNEFNLTPYANVAPENHYAGLLRMMLQMKAIRSAAPYYRNFNTALFHTAIGTGAFAIADLFENQRSPVDTKLMAGFAEGDVIGALSGLAVLQNNGDFFAGARRAILFEKEMVAYGISKAMEVTGPIQSQSSGVLQPDSIWWARHIDTVDTPVLKNSAGTIIQHPGRTIRFVGSLSSTASA